MNTILYNPLPNLVLLATVSSSSVLSLPYDSASLIPSLTASYKCNESILDWKDRAFNTTTDYHYSSNEYIVKAQVIIEFSRKVIENSVEIDEEFVDIVNDNFWELI